MDQVMNSILTFGVCILFISTSLVFITCQNRNDPEQNQEELPYTPTWQSLAKHNEEPVWFQDAKLGIYFHWGVYSVPAFGNEWYPRNMHLPGSRENIHHLQKYGQPSEFGYHDFVPLFRAEKFDAGEWAELFAQAGAKFAGPVAEHHDGFSMWDSDITPWNVGDKGPHRDITGELKQEFDKRGIKLITTFHHAKHLQRHDSINNEGRPILYPDSHYPYLEGMPPTSNDPELKMLYGNIPAEEWLETIWLGKVKEVIDKYRPDIIWFDSWLDRIPETYRQKMAAYYLNQAHLWDKEVVIVRKQDDLPLDFSVDDLEKSRKNILEPKVWMTDETISKGSWCYTENLQIKSTSDILHALIDIVSKNGVLLLNVSPKANGVIPDNQKEVLLGMGDWLKKYGESIYGTRPWYTFGEGPTKEPEGHFKNREEFLKLKYSSRDVRYTTKDKSIYAILLGWPEQTTILLESFAKEALPEPISIQSIALLGSSESIDWNHDDSGLQLSVPPEKSEESAMVYKIELK